MCLSNKKHAKKHANTKWGITSAKKYKTNKSLLLKSNKKQTETNTNINFRVFIDKLENVNTWID